MKEMPTNSLVCYDLRWAISQLVNFTFSCIFTFYTIQLSFFFLRDLKRVELRVRLENSSILNSRHCKIK